MKVPIRYCMGVTGRPAAGEDIAVARDIILSELTGCHLHVAHVSSARAVELIRQAKKERKPCDYRSNRAAPLFHG